MNVETFNLERYEHNDEVTSIQEKKQKQKTNVATDTAYTSLIFKQPQQP